MIFSKVEKLKESKLMETSLLEAYDVCSSCTSCNCDEDGSCWGPCKCYELDSLECDVKDVYSRG